VEPIDTQDIIKQIDEANTKNLEAERAQDLLKQLEDQVWKNNQQI